MARIRRKLFHTYANLDLPIQWQDPVVEAWAKRHSLSTRRDCLAVTSINDGYFKDSTKLKTFPELRLFSNITEFTEPQNSGNRGQFDCCTALESIDLSNITAITGWRFFRNCTSLKSIYLPECLDVDHQAFEGCTSLKTVIMPKVKNIGYRPFGSCTALERLDLPASVTNIWNNAFGGCTALKVITIAATTPPALDTTALSGQSAEFYVPDDAVETYKAASGWSAYASRIHPMSECPSE